MVQWDVQLKSAFDEKHRFATAGVLLSTIIVLVTLGVRIVAIVTSLLSLGEGAAIIWYVASYVPFVQNYLCSFLGRTGTTGST
jgi:hypothetical protein